MENFKQLAKSCFGPGGVGRQTLTVVTVVLAVLAASVVALLFYMSATGKFL